MQMSNLPITKWVILFTQVDFFFSHEEGWLQDFFIYQGLLELFNMIMRRYTYVGYGSGFWMEVAGFVTHLQAVKT